MTSAASNRKPNCLKQCGNTSLKSGNSSSRRASGSVDPAGHCHQGTLLHYPQCFFLSLTLSFSREHSDNNQGCPLPPLHPVEEARFPWVCLSKVRRILPLPHISSDWHRFANPGPVIFKVVGKVGDYHNWLKFTRPTYRPLTCPQFGASKKHVLFQLPELFFLPIAVFLDHGQKISESSVIFFLSPYLFNHHGLISFSLKILKKCTFSLKL